MTRAYILALGREPDSAEFIQPLNALQGRRTPIRPAAGRWWTRSSRTLTTSRASTTRTALYLLSNVVPPVHGLDHPVQPVPAGQHVSLSMAGAAIRELDG